MGGIILIGDDAFEVTDAHSKTLKDTQVNDIQKTDQERVIEEIREKTTEMHNALFGKEKSEKIDIEQQLTAKILLKNQKKRK